MGKKEASKGKGKAASKGQEKAASKGQGKAASKGKGKAAKQKKHKKKLPPLMGSQFPDESWGPESDMPPWMRGPFPDETWGPEGNMPPWMRGPFPDETWGPEGDTPPWMMDGYPDEMWGPEGDMPPDMGRPFPGPRFRGPMPLGIRGPFPGPRFRSPMPPGMRGPFPGPRFRDPVPPDVRGPFPGPRHRGPMPSEMRDHFPGPSSEGPMPPEMQGPLLGPRSGGPMPSEMRGHFPGPRSEGPMPPEMQGPLQGPRSGGPMPSEMRDHFPGPRSEGPMPLEMQGPLQGPRSGGPMPSEMRDHFPGPRSEGPMPPEMQGPLQGPKSGGPMPLEMRGPFPGPRSEGPIPPWAGEPNAPQSATWPEAGVGAGRPGPSPALWQEELEQYGPGQGENYSFPSESHSSDHRASSTVANNHYLQESAAKILESFGLSNEDLEELSLYPEDQLKPENIPQILKEIRMKKAARQLPEFPSQKAVGEDGLYSPSAAQMPMAPVSSEPWRMNCPTPSMMSDYRGSSPRLFPHTCSLCKIECKHLRGWILHLSTPVHLESCHRLRQQYPEWKLDDPSFNNRSGNQAPSQWPGSSTPGHSSSGQDMHPPRSRSRSPLHRKEMPPAEAHAKPKSGPQPTALNSLVEKSVLQAMSMLQAGGTGAAGSAALPSLQLDSAALSLGLVSMMQLVATQVVQTVLSSKEIASEQAKPNTAALTPQPSTSVSDGAVKSEAETIPRPPAGGAQARGPRRVLICGHGIVAQASRRAEASLCGSQLGLCSSLATIEWLGWPGLFWDQLLPTLAPYLEASSPPDILVLHLGENDLETWTSVALSLRIREDLARIREKVPGIGLLWSFLLERPPCPQGGDLQRVSHARAKINEDVRRAVEAAGGASIPHSNIKGSCANLFQRGGWRLSNAGCDYFLRNLKQGLLDFLHSQGKGRGGPSARPWPSHSRECLDPH